MGKKAISALLMILALAACTPGDVSYCENKGLRPQTPEWAQCLNYYHRNKDVFTADRAHCLAESKLTYPDSLYDRGRIVRRPVFDRFGGYRGTATDYAEDDWWQNQQLDSLRHGMIVQCMQKKGWNDADKWEMGGRKLR